LTSNTQEAAPAGILTDKLEPDISTATGTFRMSGISEARTGEPPHRRLVRARARLRILAIRETLGEPLRVAFVFFTEWEDLYRNRRVGGSPYIFNAALDPM
jgi:hypothetical protein